MTSFCLAYFNTMVHTIIDKYGNAGKLQNNGAS